MLCRRHRPGSWVQAAAALSTAMIWRYSHPFDVVLSSWLQMIKDESQTFCFPRYMDKVIDRTNSPSMLTSFDLFHSLGLPLTVLNFDHHRHNIAVLFLRAIGAENIFDQVELTITREANRSLTPSTWFMARGKTVVTGFSEIRRRPRRSSFFHLAHGGDSVRRRGVALCEFGAGLCHCGVHLRRRGATDMVAGGDRAFESEHGKHIAVDGG